VRAGRARARPGRAGRRCPAPRAGARTPWDRRARRTGSPFMISSSVAPSGPATIGRICSPATHISTMTLATSAECLDQPPMRRFAAVHRGVTRWRGRAHTLGSELQSVRQPRVPMASLRPRPRPWGQRRRARRQGVQLAFEPGRPSRARRRWPRRCRRLPGQRRLHTSMVNLPIVGDGRRSGRREFGVVDAGLELSSALRRCVRRWS
jgi:hypothetical protein